jgi:lipoprotein-releasing system ATP-binding protein
MSSNEIADFRNKNIGFVFQFHHLLPEFTAYENIMIPSLIAGLSKKAAKIKAIELIESVGLKERAHHKPSELSGGEQQRVAIARALINNPSIILADEPTGNLDSRNSNTVLDLIGELRDKYKITFIVATHSSEVSERAQRIVVIQDGKIKLS